MVPKVGQRRKAAENSENNCKRRKTSLQPMAAFARVRITQVSHVPSQLSAGLEPAGLGPLLATVCLWRE